MAFNEDRKMQEIYRSQKDNQNYRDAREVVKEDRQLYEENLMIERRTVTNGNAHKGRRVDGVKVLSGNENAVFSDTKADGSRMNYYVTGIATVNEEASKIDGAPIAPGEDTPWEYSVGSETTAEGEM